jgi:hypothetical protein
VAVAKAPVITAKGDSFPEKLVKYVPAETLAFFVPAAAAVGPSRTVLLVVTLVVAATGTVGYLWSSARSLPPAEKPLPHFYILAVVAFLCWALATTPNVAALARADQTTAAIVISAAVFLIPLCDTLLGAIPRKT